MKVCTTNQTRSVHERIAKSIHSIGISKAIIVDNINTEIKKV